LHPQGVAIGGGFLMRFRELIAIGVASALAGCTTELVCAKSADCAADPTKPICDVANQKCVACTADSQCVDRFGANPGVCMSHQDGRCATDAETFYVANVAGCSDSGAGPTAGTAAAPFCTLQPATTSAGGSRALIVVRGPVSGPTDQFNSSTEVSVVGQQSALVASIGSSSAIGVSS
jgi:hypothetical protein